jgi:hypothetical protein
MKKNRQKATVYCIALLAICICQAAYSAPLQTASSQAMPAQATGETTVYKVTRPDGSVSFSDHAESGAKKLSIPPVITLPAIQLIQNKKISPLTQSSPNTYSSLTIVNPLEGSSFHSGSGNITVTIEISPKLMPNDLLQYQLDGKTLSSQKSTQLIIPTVDRGAHSISISIIDKNGKKLKSASSTFTVHRPSIRN